MLMNEDEFNMWTIGIPCLQKRIIILKKEQIVTYTDDYFLIPKNQYAIIWCMQKVKKL